MPVIETNDTLPTSDTGRGIVLASARRGIVAPTPGMPVRCLRLARTISLVALFVLATSCFGDAPTAHRPTARELRFSVDSLTLYTGTARLVTAAAVDAAGDIIPQPVIHWTSTDTAVMSIEVVGAGHMYAHANASGVALLIASTDGIKDTVVVNVADGPNMQLVAASSVMLRAGVESVDLELSNEGGHGYFRYSVVGDAQTEGAAPQVYYVGIEYETQIDDGIASTIGIAHGLSGPRMHWIDVESRPTKTGPWTKTQRFHF